MVILILHGWVPSLLVRSDYGQKDKGSQGLWFGREQWESPPQAGLWCLGHSLGGCSKGGLMEAALMCGPLATGQFTLVAKQWSVYESSPSGHDLIAGRLSHSQINILGCLQTPQGAKHSY